MTSVNELGDRMEDIFTPEAKPRETLNILATIEVSKGEFFHPQLTIVEVLQGGEYHQYLIQHKINHLPSPSRLWNNRGATDTYSYMLVASGDALMLVNAIEGWEKLVGHKDHLNPYTFIYSYILGKWNVDLIDIVVFDV